MTRSAPPSLVSIGNLYAWKRENLIVTIGLSKPLAQDVEASIYFFGYSHKIPFGQMPKINVRLGVLSYSVYDQKKRLQQGVVR